MNMNRINELVASIRSFDKASYHKAEVRCSIVLTNVSLSRKPNSACICSPATVLTSTSPRMKTLIPLSLTIPKTAAIINFIRSLSSTCWKSAILMLSFSLEPL